MNETRHDRLAAPSIDSEKLGYRSRKGVARVPSSRRRLSISLEQSGNIQANLDFLQFRLRGLLPKATRHHAMSAVPVWEDNAMLKWLPVEQAGC